MFGELFPVMTISVALLIGAMSPGQSFVLVAKTSLSSSRRDGLAAALGMGVGSAVFAVIALSGLHSVLLTVPWLYSALRLAGGLYLFWLAFGMLRGAGKPLVIERGRPHFTGVRKGFSYGLLTQLFNPSTALVFGSVFAALLSHTIPWHLYLILPALAFMIDFLWYALVAYALSSAGPRAAYLGCKAWIDCLGGGVMALLGIKLIISK
ncbi:LysE family translocator [Acerihabitans arboris]|uniref:LysE family transporter n=1 Tax=Acerihabitans arboris TaxID=2691583 RepID=A0A845SMY4_9GAMM|nr:LysE family transporter [Acerihabitans arboris]NDL63981.1 LysE family transporter [Acerihabitans arboris]